MNDKYQLEFNLPPINRDEAWYILDFFGSSCSFYGIECLFRPLPSTMMKMMEKLGIEPIDVIMRQNFLRGKINPPADEDICS